MWRGNKIIIFQVFSIQKITDMLSSNHYLSLYIKLITVLINLFMAKHEIKNISHRHLSLCTKLITVLNKADWQSMK